jgi:HTH-type transcriptional regulator/antitoxin HigA
VNLVLKVAWENEEITMSPKQFEKLTEAWPQISHAVRVPYSDKECEELIEILDHLVDKVGEDEDHPLASLMDVLGALIEDYEDEHVPEVQVQV